MAARDRPAFRDGTPHVIVRCPRCRVRMLEGWPSDVTGGWDGMVFAKRDPLGGGAVDVLRCQRCKATHEINNRELHYALVAATEDGRKDLTLGEVPVRSSQDW